MPASQYLALHWLSSPLIHHPALDLKEQTALITRQDTRQDYPAPSEVPVALGLSVASTRSVFLWDPCASWRVGSGIREKRRALCASPTGTCGSPRHPQESPVDDEEDTAEGQSGTLPAGTAIPRSDHSCTCPHLRSHTLPWFSDT